MRFSLKTVIILLLMLLFIFNIMGCSGEDKYEKTVFLMDTKVDITIYGNGMSNKQYVKLANEIETEMKLLESIFSSHITGSDIRRINEAAGREAVKVSPETVFVLQKALEVAEMSGGAFDPTVAPLLDLWGFKTDEPAIPSQNDLEEVPTAG